MQNPYPFGSSRFALKTIYGASDGTFRSVIEAMDVASDVDVSCAQADAQRLTLIHRIKKFRIDLLRILRPITQVVIK